MLRKVGKMSESPKCRAVKWLRKFGNTYLYQLRKFKDKKVESFNKHTVCANVLVEDQLTRIFCCSF